MKVIIFAVLMAACYAARLEHLEKQRNGYLPSAKNSNINSTEESSLHSSLEATNTIDGSTDSKPGLSARASVTANSQQILSPDSEISSSVTDPEFAGYCYGPGIQNTNNQEYSHQTYSEFGNRAPNQQFGQLGIKYSPQQARNQLFSSQGSRQQPLNQQYVKQPQIQQLAQKPFNLEYPQQAQSQPFGHQLLSQNFVEEGQRQQFGQQPFKQQFGRQHVGSQFGHQDVYPQDANNFNAQALFQPLTSFSNTQDFAAHSSTNIPQQSFDEETGYHY